jgi:glutamyl-tRNA reductase
MEVLFRSAKRIALSVKEQTLIGIGNVSVGRQAVELLQNVNGDQSQCILIVGCGAMGSLIAHVLHEKGFESIDVTNRTESRANKLVETGVAEARIEFSEYLDKIGEYDAVFFCLSSVLSYEESEKINKLSHIPKIIDVGNPQNTILLASLNKSASIYSMATIKKLTAQRYRDRIAQIEKANEIIRERVGEVHRAIEKELISVEVGLNLELSKKRLNKNSAHVAFLRSVFEKGFRNYLQEKEVYTEVHTPYVVPISTDPPRNNASEELFSV